jgi:hypothetical protein
MKKKKRTVHYVNNSDFYDALISYKEDVQKCIDKELPKPRIPNYIGDCFLKIAEHLSFNPKFVNYPFKDAMISDGYTDCVKYVLNFNPQYKDGKTLKNPFAYFTQICFYAFVRRIKQEQKVMALYDRILENKGYDEVFFEDNADSDISNFSDYNSIKDAVHSRMRY